MNTLGTRIRLARKTKGITQLQIREMCGISSGNLSEIENDKVSPTAAALFSLKRILGVSVDWLLSGDGDMFLSSDPPPDPRTLTATQRDAAENCLMNLTYDQAALINSYEKLNDVEKEEVWLGIKFKLSKKPGLSSNSQTLKNEAG